MTPKKKRITDEETIRVAANFKRLRKARGWTLYQTAQQATPHVSLAYIGHIERCNTGLGKRARRKWAKIFNVDMSEFLQPINKSEINHEIALLKKEAQKYSIDKIKKLIELMPILLKENHHAGETDKKKLLKDHAS